MNKLKLVILIFFVVCCGTAYQASAQNIPKNINIDETPDATIRQWMSQAQASGLSDDQLVQSAQTSGVSAIQAQKLQLRLADIRRRDGNTGAENKTLTPQRQIIDRDTTSVNKGNQRNNTLNIFGADLFRNGPSSTFEPNLNIPTPVNYIVGSRDQLIINVYGKSVANWNLSVTPEGNINIPGIGIIKVAGKTIEQVNELIKGKLIANNYAIGNGTSFQVSLGNIRSIKVILQGEFVKPGTFTIPSLSTVFTALSVGGGPDNIGSFRNIEVIRNGKTISHLDLYDFLIKGNQKGNVNLQDQDIIHIPTYDIRVELKGEVKIPALFETVRGETLKDLIGYSGGFTDQAYTGRIKVDEVRNGQRAITDVFEDQYSNYIPKRGDKFTIEGILNRYENRVTINGAVFHPGDFELKGGLTLSQLIKIAGGLKEDAFTGRGSITRLNSDNTRQLVSFDVLGVINRSVADIPLQREDVINISSIFDLRDQYTVSIDGAVRSPGNFAYADSMSVADLIIKAGGFKEGASPRRVEVARRILSGDPLSKNSIIASVFSVNVDAKLKSTDISFILKPFDIVSIYNLPGFQTQSQVMVEGEVLYAGPYVIEKKNEKISDIITRAGGLTAFADVSGGTLKRSNTAILGADKNNKIDTAELQKERLDRLKRLKKSAKDSTLTQELELRNDFVGIDLKKILQNPGSAIDLTVEDGDVIRIPKEQQIVRVNGEVLYPSAVVYDGGKSFNEYVLNAGGYSSDALKKRAYIVYPNGTVKGTRKFLFFNIHPQVRRGSEIFVPKKSAKNPVNAAEILGFTTGLASLGAIILGLISLKK